MTSTKISNCSAKKVEWCPYHYLNRVYQKHDTGPKETHSFESQQNPGRKPFVVQIPCHTQRSGRLQLPSWPPPHLAALRATLAFAMAVNRIIRQCKKLTSTSMTPFILGPQRLHCLMHNCWMSVLRRTSSLTGRKSSYVTVRARTRFIAIMADLRVICVTNTISRVLKVMGKRFSICLRH